MAFKLAHPFDSAQGEAQSGRRKLIGSEKLQELVDGTVFVDGIRKAA